MSKAPPDSYDKLIHFFTNNTGSKEFLEKIFYIMASKYTTQLLGMVVNSQAI